MRMCRDITTQKAVMREQAIVTIWHSLRFAQSAMLLPTLPFTIISSIGGNWVGSSECQNPAKPCTHMTTSCTMTSRHCITSWETTLKLGCRKPLYILNYLGHSKFCQYLFYGSLNAKKKWSWKYRVSTLKEIGKRRNSQTTRWVVLHVISKLNSSSAVAHTRGTSHWRTAAAESENTNG